MTDLTRFTNGSIAGRQAALPGPLRGLHRAVLRRFLDTGAPPTERWVWQAAAGHGLDAAALDQLDAADAVHIVNGVVAVAYPLSGTPTPHRAWLAGHGGLDAEILDQAAAIECGRLNFGTLICLRLRDIDAIAEEFGAAVEQMPWGAEVWLRDPDGNRLRVGMPAAN